MPEPGVLRCELPAGAGLAFLASPASRGAGLALLASRATILVALLALVGGVSATGADLLCAARLSVEDATLPPCSLALAPLATPSLVASSLSSRMAGWRLGRTVSALGRSSSLSMSSSSSVSWACATALAAAGACVLACAVATDDAASSTSPDGTSSTSACESTKGGGCCWDVVAAALARAGLCGGAAVAAAGCAAFRQPLACAFPCCWLAPFPARPCARGCDVCGCDVCRTCDVSGCEVGLSSFFCKDRVARDGWRLAFFCAGASLASDADAALASRLRRLYSSSSSTSFFRISARRSLGGQQKGHGLKGKRALAMSRGAKGRRTFHRAPLTAGWLSAGPTKAGGL